jgi:hypothetical protein
MSEIDGWSFDFPIEEGEYWFKGWVSQHKDEAPKLWYVKLFYNSLGNPIYLPRGGDIMRKSTVYGVWKKVEYPQIPSDNAILQMLEQDVLVLVNVARKALEMPKIDQMVTQKATERKWLKSHPLLASLGRDWILYVRYNSLRINDMVAAEKVYQAWHDHGEKSVILKGSEMIMPQIMTDFVRLYSENLYPWLVEGD